jgi:hypothetical protein
MALWEAISQAPWISKNHSAVETMDLRRIGGYWVDGFDLCP